MTFARTVLVASVLVIVGCKTAPVEPPPAVVDAAAPSIATTPNGEAGVDASADVDASAAAHAFVCFPPQVGPFDPCPKGAMAGDEGLRACREKHAHDPAEQPTFRVGDGATLPFLKTRWRCVAVPPETKVHVTVGTIAGVDVVVPASCASGLMDLDGPNFYGSVNFKCSTRPRAGDDVLRTE
ncbi:MAG TPA: hypothetical protein VF407_04825 [Polyangiaceae bacterium]